MYQTLKNEEIARFLENLDPNVRHDIRWLYDVELGNPNGDPDAGNKPRQDPRTRCGIVNNASPKRMIRDTIHEMFGAEPGHDIYVKHHGVLYDEQQAVHEALHIVPEKKVEKKVAKGKKAKDGEPEVQIKLRYASEDVLKARAEMCRRYWDVRAFGAVMNVAQFNCGQVVGPTQVTNGVSFDPIEPMMLAITRVAVTRSGEEKETEIGRKWIIPYGLYRHDIFYSPNQAAHTGFSGQDLGRLIGSLLDGFELHRTASNGTKTTRGVYVFSHSAKYGRVSSHKLFDLISVEKRDGITAPTSFSDYEISVDGETLAKEFPSVSLTVLQ